MSNKKITIEDLINHLDDMKNIIHENNINHENFSGFLTDESDLHRPPEFKSKLNEIIEAADHLFINSDGLPDFNRISIIKKLSNNRYMVVEGDSDNFGWLSGVIDTSFGKIVFG